MLYEFGCMVVDLGSLWSMLNKCILYIKSKRLHDQANGWSIYSWDFLAPITSRTHTREIMVRSFPWTEHKELTKELNMNPVLKRSGKHLKFINKASARPGEVVLFVEDSNGIGRVIEKCLQQPPPGTVDVFYGIGHTGKLQLRSDTVVGGYAFSGPLIASIINDNNGEMDLWGYHDQRNGVFVLTAKQADQSAA